MCKAEFQNGSPISINPSAIAADPSAAGKTDKPVDKSKGLWTRCEKCGVILYIKHLKDNNHICFGCNFHLKMSSSERVEHLIDPGTWRSLDDTLSPMDPLEFFDLKGYPDRIKEAQDKTGMQDGLRAGTGLLHGIPVALGVMEFGYMGGSMGSVVGEKLTRLIEYATQEGLSLIIVSTSGGARMQEGIFSLMQVRARLMLDDACAILRALSGRPRRTPVMRCPPLAYADGKDLGGVACSPERGQPAVCVCADIAHHGRRHRKLWHARGHHCEWSGGILIGKKIGIGRIPSLFTLAKADDRSCALLFYPGQVAEPGAIIGFAGRRVIEQTLQEQLPDDFQTAEYLLNKGLLDLVIPRSFLKGALFEMMDFYKDAPYKKQGRIPFGVQHGTFLTAEEKIRRRYKEWTAGGNGKALASSSSPAEAPSYKELVSSMRTLLGESDKVDVMDLMKDEAALAEAMAAAKVSKIEWVQRQSSLLAGSKGDYMFRMTPEKPSYLLEKQAA